MLHSQNRNKLKHGSCEASPNQANLRGSAQRFWQHRRHAQAGSSARSCDHSERCGSVHGDRQNPGGQTPKRLQLLRSNRAHAPASSGPCRHVSLLSETDSARCAPKKVRTLSDHLKKSPAAQDKRGAWVRNSAEACGPVQTAESAGSKEKPLPAHFNRSSTSGALHPNSSGEAGTEAEESDVPCFSLW